MVSIIGQDISKGIGQLLHEKSLGRTNGLLRLLVRLSTSAKY